MFCLLRWVCSFSKLCPVLSSRWSWSSRCFGKMARQQLLRYRISLLSFVTLLLCLGHSLLISTLGRYRTILLFSSFYLTGWIILTCTATLASLATGAGFSGYVISLIIIGLGTGSIKRYEQVTRRAHRSPEPADDNLLHIEI